MDFTLSYGYEKIQLSMPDSGFLGELRPKAVKPDITVAEMLNDVIKEKLGNLAVKPTLIILPDKTRNSGAKQFLPIILACLQQIGINQNDITFLMANGSHIANEPDEVSNILGQEISGNYKVIQHDAHDKENLVYMGQTSFETPVYINRNIVEAKQILIVGTAIHHYFAGFGGGPKMIVPGCAGYETITHNHALTISQEAGGIHRDCRSGSLDNPLQIDFREAIKDIKIDLLIETVLNEKGEIVKVFSGELFDTHREACEYVDRIFKVPVKQKADLVIVSCGGAPKDINFIQAHKSLHNAFQAVKEGGTILMLAECPQAIGSKTFIDWFEWGDFGSLLNELVTNYTLNGTTALSVITKSKLVDIILSSELPSELVKKMGMIPTDSAENGLTLATQKLSNNFDYYVIPNGSVTLPIAE